MKMSEWKQSADLMQSVGVSATGGGGSGSLFIKLKSGDSVTGVFLGQPESRAIVWDESRGHSVKYDPAIHAKTEMRLKHAFNFYDLDTKEMRILEINHATRISLGEIATKIETNGSELDHWICKVSRRGAGKDTQYWIDNVKQMGQGEIQWMQNTYLSDHHDLGGIMNDGNVADAAKAGFAGQMTAAPPAPMAAPVAAPVAAPMAAPVAAPTVGNQNDFDLF